MNSEELELSLRTEFESYLKDVFAEVRQEISQLQEKFDAELERHKSELDSVFSNVLNRFETTQDLDAGFKDSVVEHLRLAKDEGARITATAIAQAEELQEKSAPSAAIKEIHEAISDISSQQSQAEILKSLVQHAEKFAARGAFFIIKNEHLVGWRGFGSENPSTDEKLREIVLPLSSESILSEAVKSLETVNSSSISYDDDAELFSRFEFNEAQQLTAIPLIARNRGVAVLYADGGTNGLGSVDVEALETLVRVAGLTVEVLASSKGSTRRETVKPAFVVSETSPSKTSVEETTEEQEFTPQPEEVFAETTETNDYSAPEAEFEEKAETFSDEISAEPQPFYDPAPSIAPSVREDVSEEAATEELPAQSFTDAYQTEEYRIEEPVEKTEFKSDEWSPIAEDVENRETIETTNEETPSEEYAVSSDFVETPDYSAREYAENFAKETDPSEYAREFSYQTEEPKVEDSKEFSYSSEENQPEELKDFSYKSEESSDFSYQPSAETNFSYSEPKSEFQYNEPADSDKYETPLNETVEAPVENFTSTSEPTYETFEPQVEKPEESVPPVEQSFQTFEPVSQPIATTPPKSRLSERNVDLPIEVSEDERRLHNDARRFARLLVSEIKLYNEQKVKEGRESGDLYDRLREAIDRSREMYDKRVQPPVAAKFDYFHYEILNTLAEGDENKLGAGYPGSNA